MSVLVRLPFPAALAILAAATAGGVVAYAHFESIVYLIATIVVVGAFAVLYLREYSRLPGPAPRPPRAQTARPRSEFFAGEAAAAAPAPVEVAHKPDTGPVEVDRFDPEYDPVAEADEIETHAPTKPAPPPES
ncbi:MAG: hypothetical protein L3K00_08120 [Thermoplasmata archaeon]|nr:hypothetical protein [Thermoplasmata archaeon]